MAEAVVKDMLIHVYAHDCRFPLVHVFTSASANNLQSRAPYSPPPRVDHRLLYLPLVTRLPATAVAPFSALSFAIGWLSITMGVHPLSFLLPFLALSAIGTFAFDFR